MFLPKTWMTPLAPALCSSKIKGNLPGKTIGFRADIDALKMKDLSGKEWSSQIDGQAHACGHDGHQTWLMGAAAYMAEHRDFPGTLVCVFQGAEEIGKGSRKRRAVRFPRQVQS